MDEVLIELARAGAGDHEALVALLAVQLAEHGVPQPEAVLSRAVTGVIDDPARGFFFVARAGGRVVGLAYTAYSWTMEHGGTTCWLEELYVLPERRNAGIGQRLLEASMARAREAGCRAMDLEVDADHARAERLYQRNGFRAHRRVHWMRLLD